MEVTLLPEEKGQRVEEEINGGGGSQMERMNTQEEWEGV